VKPKFKFSHRSRGTLYWKRRLGNGFEEQITANALWFFGQISDDDSLPPCDGTCGARRGLWGATGIMPPGHVLVSVPNRQYLAHGEWSR
jgi:hypothetical protein